MSTIVLRSTKGSALTFAEGDANFTNLNTDKLENITSESAGDLSDVDLSSNTNGNVLTFNAITGNLELQAPAAGGISDVVDDTTPQLGGDLDAQGNKIQNPVLEDYAETIYTIGLNDAPSITVSNGNVQTVIISAGLDLPAFSDAATGQTVTLIVNGSGSLTGTVNHIFAGGNKTLTTKSIVSILYDGTSYWTSVATDFQ
jgi:hypothetical protein